MLSERSPCLGSCVGSVAGGVLGLVVVLACRDALAEDPPSVRPVFPPQGQHVHSSSIVELPDGSLVVCWFQGSGERTATDVAVRGARLPAGGEAWSTPFLMADTPGLADCNPVLFLDARDRLWLFWIVVKAGRWEESLLKYRRADAPTGAGPPRWTWQDAIVLVPGDSFAEVVERAFEDMRLDEGLWAEYAPPYPRLIVEAARDPRKRQSGWMTRTKPRTLPSGRIVLPLYSDGFNVSLMALSDDRGETWRPSAPIVGLGPIQPAVARRRDGVLVAFLRDSGGPPQRVMRSESRDDGATWSIARDTDVPNPGSSIEVLVLRDGRWLLAHNDTERGRHRLAVALSTDEGETWGRPRVLAEAEPGAGSYSYPSVIQTRDGRVHVTYSAAWPEGKWIAHASLGVEALGGE